MDSIVSLRSNQSEYVRATALEGSWVMLCSGIQILTHVPAPREVGELGQPEAVSNHEKTPDGNIPDIMITPTHGRRKSPKLYINHSVIRSNNTSSSSCSAQQSYYRMDGSRGRQQGAKARANSRHPSSRLSSPAAEGSNTLSSQHAPNLLVLLQNFRELRKHRASMSYHLLRYREQFNYVKQDHSSLGSAVAILQQEVGKATVAKSDLDQLKIRNLVERLAVNHEAVADGEALLEDLHDEILREERLLKEAEEYFGHSLGILDLSDEDDDELFNTFLKGALSLPSSPTNESHNKQMQARRKFLAPEDTPLPISRASSRQNNEHGLARSSLRLSETPSSDSAKIYRKETCLQNLLSNTIVQRNDSAISNTEKSVLHTGLQFAVASGASAAEDVTTDEVFGSSTHEAKRDDLQDLLCNADQLEIYKCQPVDQDDSTSEPGMMSRMFRDIMKPWLGFSGFYVWIGWNNKRMNQIVQTGIMSQASSRLSCVRNWSDPEEIDAKMMRLPSHARKSSKTQGQSQQSSWARTGVGTATNIRKSDIQPYNIPIHQETHIGLELQSHDLSDSAYATQSPISGRDSPVIEVLIPNPFRVRYDR